MATEAQIAANRKNAQSSTGPRTKEGKATSSRNAITLGLFTMQDFVRPDETDAYHQLCKSFWEHLQPSGPLEQTFVSEIIRATWRLRRCSVIEASMSDRVGDSSIDPMEDPWHSALQNTVDRASARANNTLRRATTELRRLQTERQIRNELLPGADVSTLGLASLREVTAAKSEFAKQTRSAAATRPTERTQSSSIQTIPTRSAPCPCGSGLKYKRCCGPNAPALLSLVA
jgi:hypothetical protein